MSNFLHFLSSAVALTTLPQQLFLILKIRKQSFFQISSNDPVFFLFFVLKAQTYPNYQPKMKKILFGEGTPTGSQKYPSKIGFFGFTTLRLWTSKLLYCGTDEGSPRVKMVPQRYPSPGSLGSLVAHFSFSTIKWAQKGGLLQLHSSVTLDTQILAQGYLGVDLPNQP